MRSEVELKLTLAELSILVCILEESLFILLRGL